MGMVPKKGKVQQTLSCTGGTCPMGNSRTPVNCDHLHQHKFFIVLGEIDKETLRLQLTGTAKLSNLQQTVKVVCRTRKSHKPGPIRCKYCSRCRFRTDDFAVNNNEYTRACYWEASKRHGLPYNTMRVKSCTASLHLIGLIRPHDCAEPQYTVAAAPLQSLSINAACCGLRTLILT